MTTGSWNVEKEMKMIKGKGKYKGNCKFSVNKQTTYACPAMFSSPSPQLLPIPIRLIEHIQVALDQQTR